MVFFTSPQHRVKAGFANSPGVTRVGPRSNSQAPSSESTKEELKGYQQPQGRLRRSRGNYAHAKTMKTNTSKLVVLSLVPAAVLVCTSCSSTDSAAEGGTAATASRETSTQKGVPGGVVIDTYQITAKVAEVDHAKRTYTLETPDGRKTPYKAGPEVINFDQVRVGDRVRATVTDSLVIRVRDKGEVATSADGETGVIAVTPKGSKPGVLMADTIEVTTRVKSVDPANHKATLEYPDGGTRTVSVRPDVKLSAADVGREVVIRSTEAVAIKVEKQ